MRKKNHSHEPDKLQLGKSRGQQSHNRSQAAALLLLEAIRIVLACTASSCMPHVAGQGQLDAAGVCCHLQLPSNSTQEQNCEQQQPETQPQSQTHQQQQQQRQQQQQQQHDLEDDQAEIRKLLEQELEMAAVQAQLGQMHLWRSESDQSSSTVADLDFEQIMLEELAVQQMNPHNQEAAQHQAGPAT